ncbi:cation/H(+) antiporter 15-like [Senna tora]|uniref:Cation/H(+) antiporter 15-like n=1 Tax=Senna tora TaxID=362788 RepID=A0A834SGS9_9FABA|nr:cation/H(+) antiporter 15-like [Senna tora]
MTIPPLFLETFSPRGILTVEVMCNLGVIYYSFLTGLQINLDNILRAQRKATTIAISGVIIPLIMGCALYSIHRKTFKPDKGEFMELNLPKAYLLWSLSLTVTGFPVLAQILANLKLLYTELGRSALDAAKISDTYSWLLFMFLVPFTINDYKGIYTVLSIVVFVGASVLLVRPFLTRIIDRRMDEGEEWNDMNLLMVLMGTLLCAYITDVLGAHSISGAFVFGLILPHSKFAEVMMSSVNDFASGVVIPLFFAGSGMRMNLGVVFNGENWVYTVLLIVLLCTPKIISTLVATYFYGISVRDGVGLGLLLNTKGVMALVILNIAWDRSILRSSSYTIIASSLVLMTMISSIIINLAYKPTKRYERNKLRTIQNLRLDAELRILACVHNGPNARSMVHLLEGFKASRVSPLHVFVLYLIELTTHGGFLLINHMEDQNLEPQKLTQTQAELEYISNTFDELAEVNDAIRVDTFSVMSSYATIHEDVVSAADEKRTSLILLPFHKQLNAQGSMEIFNSAASYRDINQNMINVSPCSLGIFVDRDMGSLFQPNFQILTLFIGGPDDREALAVAWRLAAYSGVQVSLVRMLLYDEAAEVNQSANVEVEDQQGMLSQSIDKEKHEELDEEYVNSFRLRAMNNEDTITYSEREVHVGEDIPALLNDLDQIGYNLYIVGHGKGRNSMVFSRFLEWCDFPELGVIGNLLVSDNFSSKSSVLVVHQYGYGGMVFGNNHESTRSLSNNNVQV